MTGRHVVAIGQLPPPINGFSHITACVIERLRVAHDVTTFNVTGTHTARGARKHLSRLMATLAACRGLARSARHADRAAYIACDGGLGLVFTLLTIWCARGLGYPILLHHHSFAYIDRKRLLMAALVRLGGRHLTHVFLCATMRDRFERTYQHIVRSVVLSNAAFVPPQPAPCAPGSTLVLGHLSNLTREKGLYHFLDLMRRAVGDGLDVRGVLAGPAALDEDRAAIAAAVADLSGRLEYRGPLYGPDKDRFYRDIGVFVFPTEYVNEAQPTVLFEAQAAGGLIISFDRGCIASQVGEQGVVVARDGDFGGAALAWLRDLARDGTSLDNHRAAVQRSHRARYDEANQVIAELIDEATI